MYLGPKQKPHFEIVSLSGSKWMFETPDAATAKNWEAAVQERIAACLNENLSGGAKNNMDARTTKQYSPLTRL